MSDAAAKIAARLEEMWRTSRPVVLARIAEMHAAHSRLTQNAEDTEARSQGREAAHKLAGVLGVFGLPQGSEMASAIEDQLRDPNVPLTPERLATLRTMIGELDAIVASKPVA